MSSKAIFVFVAQALFVQSVISQCTSRAAIEASGYPGPFGRAGPGMAFDRFGAYDGLAPGRAFDGLGWAGRACGPIAPAMDFTPTSGGGLTVTSASPVPPTGLSVVSENVFEGALAVAGELPFVGTTTVEALLPTAGAGAINHACGDGTNAMVSEGAAFAPGYAATAIAPAGILPGAAVTPAAAAYAAPFAGRFGVGGCGRDIVY